MMSKTEQNLMEAFAGESPLRSVCGYTCEKEPPDECPVCGAKSKAFVKVN